MSKTRWAVWLGSLMMIPALAAPPAHAADKVVNVYNWSDYIGPGVNESFEKATGVKVNYDTFDSNETLEAKLSAGNSGYDIAIPTMTPFLARGIKSGLYQKIDKTKLKNYGNIDPSLLKTMAANDPGNEYAVPWITAVDVIGFNLTKVKEIDPNAPIDSWKMIFDPAVASKFKGCGIEILDSPTDIIPLTLFYLGLDPNSEKPEDLTKATDTLFKIRPYIRKFDSSGYINDLANGDACLVIGWSTDIAVAANRAKEAGKKYEIGMSIPKEGSQTYVDTVAIPAGAPHYEQALQWIDHILTPEASADTSNTVGGRTGNIAALKLIDPKYTSNPGLFPPAAVQATLYTIGVASRDFERQRTRAWTRIKTGR